MQYMLHNGPYRARPRQSLFFALLERLASGYAVALKFVFIGCVAFGFYQLVAYLLTLSDSMFIQLVALAAWSCGAIPLMVRLWQMDLRSAASVDGVVRMQNSSHPRLRQHFAMSTTVPQDE